MNFDLLIEQVEHTHVFLQKSALTAVNINLSLRNWLIGFYIRHSPPRLRWILFYHQEARSSDSIQ